MCSFSLRRIRAASKLSFQTSLSTRDIAEFSRALGGLTRVRRGRWREMRSEKDQMTVGKEKCVVEIQFRDIPREQENTSGNSKQKEEKKEVFTKVGRRGFAPLSHCLRCLRGGRRNRHGGDAQEWFQHRGQRREFEAVDSRRSRGFTCSLLGVAFPSDCISCNEAFRLYRKVTCIDSRIRYSGMQKTRLHWILSTVSNTLYGPSLRAK